MEWLATRSWEYAEHPLGQVERTPPKEATAVNRTTLIWARQCLVIFSICLAYNLCGRVPGWAQTSGTLSNRDYAECEKNTPVQAAFDWLKFQQEKMALASSSFRDMDAAQRTEMKGLLDKFHSPADLGLFACCFLDYRRELRLEFDDPPFGDALDECLQRLGAQTNSAAIDGLRRIAKQSHGALSELIDEFYDRQGKAIRERMERESSLPLLKAARKGDLAEVKKLLGQGADVNAEDPRRGGTALHEAAYWGRPDVAALLIESGAQVNGDKNYSPLNDAAWRGNTEVAELLLEKGADVNQAGAVCVPVQSAVERDHVDTVRLLIAHGADLKAPHPDMGYDLLDVAADRGCLEMVQLLLAHGLNANGLYGEKPLYHAAQSGNRALVEYLIAQGAEVNYRGEPWGDRFDQDAIMAAASHGRKEVFDLLLDKGAKVDFSLALIAAAEGCNLELVQELVDKGANVNAEGETSGTPLEAAARGGNVDVMRYLVGKGADLKKGPGSYDRTLLCEAASHNRKEMVDYLLAQGLDINAGNAMGTPLQACLLGESKQQAMIEYLLSKGADLEARGAEGGTVLHTAAEHGDFEEVQFLVKAGAKVNTLDIEVATDRDMYEFLRSHGGKGKEEKNR